MSRIRGTGERRGEVFPVQHVALLQSLQSIMRTAASQSTAGSCRGRNIATADYLPPDVAEQWRAIFSLSPPSPTASVDLVSIEGQPHASDVKLRLIACFTIATFAVVDGDGNLSAASKG